MPVAFVADGRTPVAGEPGEGAFDLPLMAAQSGGVVDAAASDARDDAPAAQPMTVAG